MGPDDDFNVLSEGDEEAQKPFHRELPEVAMQHLRDIGLPHPEEARRLDLLEAALFEQRVDPADELRPEEMVLGGSLR